MRRMSAFAPRPQSEYPPSGFQRLNTAHAPEHEHTPTQECLWRQWRWSSATKETAVHSPAIAIRVYVATLPHTARGRFARANPCRRHHPAGGAHPIGRATARHGYVAPKEGTGCTRVGVDDDVRAPQSRSAVQVLSRRQRENTCAGREKGGAHLVQAHVVRGAHYTARMARTHTYAPRGSLRGRMAVW